MRDEELLGIGAFAVLGGLTVEALRDYHEIGLLIPARVEPSTGYRFYRREQIRDAQVVQAHRERLSTRARLVAEQLAMLEQFIEKGVSVPVPKGNRIVMINIAVDDLERSRRFCEELLEVEFAEERHGDGPLHLNATFGEWNTPSWFLLSLWPDSSRAGTIDIGFIVEDLDRAYERALAAGGSNVHAPRDIQGMPRTAQIEDPNGNQIGLYQA